MNGERKFAASFAAWAEPSPVCYEQGSDFGDSKYARRLLALLVFPLIGVVVLLLFLR